jgi:hypothetical protein
MTIFQFLRCCFVEGKMSCYAHDEHLDLEAQEVDSKLWLDDLNIIDIEREEVMHLFNLNLITLNDKIT